MTEAFSFYQGLVLVLFVIGYLCIIFEHSLGINKTTSALLTASACWIAYFAAPTVSVHDSVVLTEVLSETAQIVFFILAALAIVETIQVHGGLNIISRLLNFPSKKKCLWIVGFVTFFLSSILDNLTTTIVMIMLVRKLLESREDRLIFGSIIVIAANAGGAWTPIGDVTTTMLWVGGQISSGAVMRNLFLPSVACVTTSLLFAGRMVKGDMPLMKNDGKSGVQPHATLVLFVGLFALLCAPLFRALTGLPPFLGILTGMALLWLLTDYLHRRHLDREHLRMPAVLPRIDIMSLLFFLGILLSVGALRIEGILSLFANGIDNVVSSKEIVAVFIGFLSSIVDNVPLVAACMGMYDLALHPMNSPFWMLSAYCAGTGGSILIIGSAAGVAFMGLERVDFFWYMKKATIPALAGYLVGVGVYMLQVVLL